jgi:hypothetical protein
VWPHPFFVTHKLTHNFFPWKSPKMSAKRKNRPMGENSPKLVTLIVTVKEKECLR